MISNFIPHILVTYGNLFEGGGGGGELLQYSCVLPLSHFHFLEARQEWPVMT